MRLGGPVTEHVFADMTASEASRADTGGIDFGHSDGASRTTVLFNV